MIITRPIRLPADATAVEALDRTFTTTVAYEVRRRPTADGKGAELWTVTPKGTIAAQATATLA